MENLVAILVSVLLSFLVGIDRERSDKPAGLRSCMLVCIGATLFTIISLKVGFIPGADPGRSIAYIIPGIGFMGSGVILQHKGSVEGVTTAAVLWTTAAIGILCGLGEYVLASVSTLLIFTILKLKHLEIKREEKK